MRRCPVKHGHSGRRCLRCLHSWWANFRFPRSVQLSEWLARAVFSMYTRPLKSESSNSSFIKRHGSTGPLLSQAKLSLTTATSSTYCIQVFASWSSSLIYSHEKSFALNYLKRACAAESLRSSTPIREVTSRILITSTFWKNMASSFPWMKIGRRWIIS